MNLEDIENLKDEKAIRRENKTRPRMHQHGRATKKLSNRGILKIVKIERKRRKKNRGGSGEKRRL